MSEFKIAKVNAITLTAKDGTDLMKKEKTPIMKEDITLEDSVKELLIDSTIPLEWMSEKPFTNYGIDVSTNMCEKWIWDIEKINVEKDEGILSYMLAMISSYWLRNYEYWNAKNKYDFKKYRYNHGDNPYTFTAKPFSIDF